jgi:hypothetical protein
MTPEEQVELFIKTARELGVDEIGEEFERAFAKVAAQGRGGTKRTAVKPKTKRLRLPGPERHPLVAGRVVHCAKLLDSVPVEDINGNVCAAVHDRLTEQVGHW